MYHTRLLVKCDPAYSEILMAELSQANFDTFLENESGFEAYVEEDRYDKFMVEDIRKKYEPSTSLEFSFSQIAKRNWNEEWEKNYLYYSLLGDIYAELAPREAESNYRAAIDLTRSEAEKNLLNRKILLLSTG